MSKRPLEHHRTITRRAVGAVGTMTLAVVLALASVASTTSSTAQSAPEGPSSREVASSASVLTPAQRLAIRVRDGRLVNRHGNPVRLLGVNRSGTQYACVEGWGIFDGPTDLAALQAIHDWGANAVRVSLNEHCWLGINGVDPRFSGRPYRRAIAEFVDRLNAVGMRVVLDLHWNAPGLQRATGQQPMADRAHAPDFWRSVAARFRSNRSVVLDLYNEPHPDSNRNTTAAWRCVRDGGICPGVPFPAAGMQRMLNVVRSTGARNVVMVAGPQYAGQLDRWSAFKPADPLRQLAASVHVYYDTPESPDWSPCYLQSCWEQTIAPLARTTPVVIGELGEHDCSSGLIDGTAMTPPQESLLTWADRHRVSYLAWSWTTANCAGEPALISDWAGTPTAYGAGIRDHLTMLRSRRGG